MAKDTLRLDKAVSHNFDVPRSYAAKLIKAGDVEVDGEVVTDPAAKVSIESQIVIDGNEVAASDGFKKRVFMLNKPNAMFVRIKITITQLLSISSQIFQSLHRCIV